MSRITKTQVYNEDSIKVLKGLEQVRKRPVMYLGERGSQMVWRMLKEPVDNAGDEASAGRNDYIEVYVNTKTNEYIIKDKAQGIPVGKHKTENKSTLEVVLTTLHAGGKFDDKAYKTSCFVGSTKIRLLDGTVRTIKWLTDNYYDRSFWVISSKEDGTIVPGLAYFPRKTKTISKLIEVTLDNGKKERCTLDHRWMMRDGSYKQAKKLKVGDSLMPMHYRIDSDGRLEFHPNTLKQPYLQEKPFERLKSTKFLKMHRAIYSFFHPNDYVFGSHVHHANLNPSDDRPENLVYLPKGDHGTLHYAIGRILGTSDDRALIRYNKSEKGRKKSSEIGKNYSYLLTDYANSDEGKIRASKHMSDVNRSKKDLQQMGRIIRSYLHITKNLNLKFNRINYTEYRTYGSVNYDNLKRYFPRFKDLKDYIPVWVKNRSRAGQSLDSILESLNNPNRKKANECASNYNNHKVIKTEIICVDNESVYDITVDIYNNFLLDSGVFVHNSGTHGVGVSATNACSDTMKVWTYRDGKCWHQEYNKGIPKFDVKESKVDAKILKLLTDKSKQGTILYFVPDQTVVAKDNTKAVIGRNQCLSWLSNYAQLNKDLTIKVTFDDKQYTFINKIGVEKMMTSLEKSLNATRSGRTFVLEVDNCTCAFAFSDYVEGDGLKSYVCNSPTKNGGTHVKGFINAFTKSVQKHALKKDKFKVSDLMGSIIGVLHWRMSEPEFTSQIKDCLDSNVTKDVEELLSKPIDAFFVKNKKLARDIIKRAAHLTSSREAYKKVMQAVSEVKKASNRSLLPTVLASAVKAKPEDREIYLVEGDSSFGCHFGNVEVLLHDGTIKTFEQLVTDYDNGISNYGIAFNLKTKEPEIFELDEPRIIKEVTEYTELVLADGTVWRGTHSHPWLLTDGTYKAACELTCEDDIQEIQPF